MNQKSEQAYNWLQNTIKQINHTDTTLQKQATYNQIETSIVNSYQAMKKSNVFNNAERTKAYYYTIFNYVTYTSKTTLQRAQIYIFLQQIITQFQLKIKLPSTGENLQSQCQKRCNQEKNEWSNSFFCEICQDTPVAQLIERFKLLPTHKEPYFFQTIMFEIVYILGKKWFKQTICQDKECEVCQESCKDVQRYIHLTFDTDAMKYATYASGFRIIHLIENQLVTKSKIKSLVNKVVIPNDIKKVLSLLVDLVNKAEVKDYTLTWEDINSLVELLQLVPAFVFQSISQKYLEPQGIQFVPYQKPNEALLRWLTEHM